MYSPYLRYFGDRAGRLLNRVADNFWRTYTGVEIDIVEERAGGLYAYECKWRKSRSRVPESFLAAYPGASFETITRKNYLAYAEA